MMSSISIRVLLKEDLTVADISLLFNVNVDGKTTFTKPPAGQSLYVSSKTVAVATAFVLLGANCRDWRQKLFPVKTTGFVEVHANQGAADVFRLGSLMRLFQYL
jgi:hypothetical protein